MSTKDEASKADFLRELLIEEQKLRHEYGTRLALAETELARLRDVLEVAKRGSMNRTTLEKIMIRWNVAPHYIPGMEDEDVQGTEDVTWLIAEITRLNAALVCAEAALADIGDADREPGDDLAWCEKRAAAALPVVRAALRGNP